MTYRVELSKPARRDLDRISDWIEEQADGATADAYVARIYRRVFALSDFPNRGTPHESIAPGIRTLRFERTLRIAYRVVGDRVEIYRIYHGASDIFRD